MYWSPFLHIYQPPTQFPQVLKKIIRQSYRPLVKIISASPKAKLTLNINSSLTEQLVKYGGEDVVRQLADLAKKGQIEFTGSAAYHPLLTKIPHTEMVRQIRINEDINHKFFGEGFSPKGFFPPEMAFNGAVGGVVFELGYEWVLVDEVAFLRQPVARDILYRLKGSQLKIFPRDKDVSLAIAFAQIGTVSEFKKFLGERLKKHEYLITAMDGETFGHHWPGRENFLGELLGKSGMETIFISEVPKYFKEEREADLMESTWGAGYEQTLKGEVYPRWNNPSAALHPLQWELTHLAIDTVTSSAKPDKALPILDRALHSDQYWWASASPCWHPTMVRRGAGLLAKAILETPDAPASARSRAQKLAKEIYLKGCKLYGRRIIPC